MVFTVFNKDALDFLKDDGTINQIYTAYANTRPVTSEEEPGGTPDYEFLTPSEWEEKFNETGNSGPVKNFKAVDAYYVDEIKPFNVTITLHNEYGNAARFSILGVEILNEGSGMSIDDITTEKACTFVARSLSHLVPVFGADA